MPKKTPKTTRSAATRKAEVSVLDRLRRAAETGDRPLTTDEKALMAMLLAHKSEAEAFDWKRLIPEGSFLKAMTQHFKGTDISYALPLFQLIMTSASWLTQNGACLTIKGLDPIYPTLWTIGLAESGSSKTTAANRVMKILSNAGKEPVRRFDAPASDAQWIEELAENNGAFWFQDEVGKFIHSVNTSTRMCRLKEWMLKAYTHETISNRLKGEAVKREIEEPRFTFLGLTVLSTWVQDVDAMSMSDGFCQRMNYFVAQARTDTSMFDHFLNLAGDEIADQENHLRMTWNALCAQPGAAGEYTLSDEAMDYLVGWWKGLERSWGDFALPASFLRRIGYSTLRYLVVLQFLLGKSRHPIDVETAALAATYAEFHMESALYLVQSYADTTASHYRRVAELHREITKSGQRVTARAITQRLSKKARAAVSPETQKDIIALLDSAYARGDEGFLLNLPRVEKSGKILTDWESHVKRLKTAERKRNLRRLRNLRQAYSHASGSLGAAANVVPFPATRKGSGSDVPEDPVLIDDDESFRRGT